MLRKPQVIAVPLEQPEQSPEPAEPKTDAEQMNDILSKVKAEAGGKQNNLQKL